MLSNYKKFTEGMILRDHLALDRTVLANERTLLSYLRTFIGLFAAGVGLIQLFNTSFSVVAGYVLIAISPSFAVLGVRRYLKMKNKLKTLE
jgi:putative membrane protein